MIKHTGLRKNIDYKSHSLSTYPSNYKASLSQFGSKNGPWCMVCKDAGKSVAEYTSHYVKDKPSVDGVVVCPYLLSMVCRYCNHICHTPSHCPEIKHRDENRYTITRTTPCVVIYNTERESLDGAGSEHEHNTWAVIAMTPSKHNIHKNIRTAGYKEQCYKEQCYKEQCYKEQCYK